MAVDLIRNGWFSEINQAYWPGQCFSLEVEEVLFHEKSPYQDIMVFKSKTYGNVLVLDGVIQVTERDEFSYQEMFAHIPLFAHPNPKKVLVIGGGDGGILRECAKHKYLEEIHICEIDQMVIDTAKKYLPGSAIGYSDPRVKVNVGDGLVYLRNQKGQFDVIMVDSSDPVGPNQSLFQKEFYELLREALRPGGIVCTQAECQYLHLELIKELIKYTKTSYKHVEYSYVMIPSYPCGQLGYLLQSLGENEPSKPVRKPDSDMELKYYNTEIHAAAFALPTFTRKAIYED
eukprot:CAMPEP_0168560368 /NCGR_PEP_ID=MMETSP0413-20121227/11023_1 /TAXON_ID=136452 /ORGANISM="Filamoeba nolandi, Strain NC-AS-23-1" /LENGTH=287 /DNA_ID=CAMNT_0008591665 /DNA_START=72 /DNA_END=935 /DNA_ORIENTATION=+